MGTREFKTRTEIRKGQYPAKKGEWVIGVDIGYSAVKGMCANKVFCFPSYVKEVQEEIVRIGGTSDTDIMYRGEDGRLWYIGELAYDLAATKSMTDNMTELFGVDRYYTNTYTILSEVGTAIGLMDNQYGAKGNKKIVIQTGLPPQHLASGMNDVKNVFAGHHSFDLKIGDNKWNHFDYTIDFNDIFLISQPLGALFSASVGKDGHNIANAKNLFKSRIMVFDPGFGTLDLVSIRNGNIVDSSTNPNGGMKKVFEKTCEDIKEAYGVHITVPQLQRYLAKGCIRVTSRDNRGRKTLHGNTYSFENTLLSNCKKVFVNVLDEILQIYDLDSNYDIIIVTGGTSDAWKEYIVDALTGTDISLLSANMNDTSLSNIYSNVRGYFYFRTKSR